MSWGDFYVDPVLGGIPRQATTNKTDESGLYRELAPRSEIAVAQLQHNMRQILEISRRYRADHDYPWCDEPSHNTALSRLRELVDTFPPEVNE